MSHDILRESWVYQEIAHEFFTKGYKEGFEKGLQMGREEVRQHWMQRRRELLTSFVQAHFPEILAPGKQQADRIKDPEILQNVIIKLLATQRSDEARRVLFDVDKDEKPN